MSVPNESGTDPGSGAQASQVIADAINKVRADLTTRLDELMNRVEELEQRVRDIE